MRFAQVFDIALLLQDERFPLLRQYIHRPPPLIPRGQEPSQSTLTLLRISSKQTYYTEKTGQDSSGGCRSSGFRTELNPRLVLGTIIASSMTSDGSTRVPYILWTVGLTAGLSTAAVLLRSFTRLRILHTFGADDALMLIAQILTMGFAAAIFAGELHPPPPRQLSNHI